MASDTKTNGRRFPKKDAVQAPLDFPDPALMDRMPPQNRDAEMSVLGSMIRSNEAIDDVVRIVRKEDFYTDAHQKLFETIAYLHESTDKPVDPITLYEALIAKEYLDDVGGAKYIAEVHDAAPTSANAEYYAQIVREKAILRNLIQAGNDILGDAFKQTMPVDQIIAGAERMILDIAQKGVTGNVTSLETAIGDAFDRLDRRTTGLETEKAGLSTGFADLDELTAGLHDNELIILAARPSVGKTAFALNIVRHIITVERQPVFFASLEMAKIELAERLLCSQSRVDSHRIRKGTLDANDMTKLIDASHELGGGKLFIDDQPQQTMSRIAANARRLHRQQGIKLVVIDYLQLIEPENRRDPRQEQVAQISRRLKFLARELEIPVIALAQVNRSSEDRQDHRPRLSDLRESGSIEQDADAVMMIHRPDRYEPGQHEGIIEIIIAKNRSGPVGEVTLAYIKQYMRFEDFKVGTPFDG